MLQYLVILLDDTSVSYCEYENTKTVRRLMPLDVLQGGILFGMKENLSIQFVYPDYPIPDEYTSLIDSIEHVNIKPSNCDKNDADIVVYEDANDFASDEIQFSKTVVLRISKSRFFEQTDLIESSIGKVCRLNIVISDVETFDTCDYERYKSVLSVLRKKLGCMYAGGDSLQLNILSDRIVLDSMNNCGAGDTSITLAPDGRFYVCPAFYYEDESDYLELGKGRFDVGSITGGIKIKNQQLYKLEYAPLCRVCDAYQCKRCIWLNRRLTYEVNIPSKQQCVISHIERNASRDLLVQLQSERRLDAGKTIEEIEYLDPFDVVINN